MGVRINMKNINNFHLRTKLVSKFYFLSYLYKQKYNNTITKIKRRKVRKSFLLKSH